MSTVAANVEQVKDHAEQAVRTVKPWVARMVRVGFAVKGLVYIIIGFLATRAALRTGGQTTDQHGAMQAILRQPFGRVMVLIAAGGLASYALWRLIDALFNPQRDAHGVKGLMKRLARLASGIAYGSLSFTAFQMSMGTDDGGSSSRDWTATLMSQPAGGWLVGIAGAIIIAVGAWQLWRAWKVDFAKKLSLGGLGPAAGRLVIASGRVGFAARGIVFGLIGAFLLIAADRNNPNDAAGIGEALRSLETVDYGPWLLGIVAIGLIAYGVFELFEARYRRIAVG